MNSAFKELICEVVSTANIMSAEILIGIKLKSDENRTYVMNQTVMKQELITGGLRVYDGDDFYDDDNFKTATTLGKDDGRLYGFKTGNCNGLKLEHISEAEKSLAVRLFKNKKKEMEKEDSKNSPADWITNFEIFKEAEAIKVKCLEQINENIKQISEVEQSLAVQLFEEKREELQEQDTENSHSHWNTNFRDCFKKAEAIKAKYLEEISEHIKQISEVEQILAVQLFENKKVDLEEDHDLKNSNADWIQNFGDYFKEAEATNVKYLEEIKTEVIDYLGDFSDDVEVKQKTFSPCLSAEKDLKDSLNFSLADAGKKLLQCSSCPRTCKYAHEMKNHMRTHSEDRPFKCPVCPKSYKHPSDVKKHVRNHTGEKPFKCKNCPKSFTTSSSLEIHSRTHSGEKRFQCSQCPKSFFISSNLNVHLRTHTGEKPFKCSHCQRPFTNSSNLKEHLRVHTGEKPFKCSECPKSFARSSNLKDHLRIHSGEKLLVCLQCPRTFTNSANLTVHRRTHTGERPFKCSLCLKSFKKSTNLKDHLLTHTDKKSFQCLQCPKSFKRADHLRVHTKTHVSTLKGDILSS